jgi:hypothetical protein
VQNTEGTAKERLLQETGGQETGRTETGGLGTGELETGGAKTVVLGIGERKHEDRRQEGR